MTRSEFSPSVRTAAWDRCKGRCEECSAKLFPGKFQFDHIQADGLGGKPTLENCKCLCSACHGVKTHQHDRPIMQKADNQKKAHLGIKAKSPTRFRKPLEGYSYWTRRIERAE